MNKNKIVSASKELALEIAKCITSLRNSYTSDEQVYAVALVILDDFSDLQLYANTEQHFSDSDNSALRRWYFAEFESEGIPLDFDCLPYHLNEVEDSDEEPEKGNAVDWLVAMTYAMKSAKEENVFNFNGKEATIFCSMVDSLNATWIEELSAHFLNDAKSYAAAEPGIRSAQQEWYGLDDEENSSDFKSAYQQRLSEYISN